MQKPGFSREMLKLFSFRLKESIPEIKPRVEIDVSVHNQIIESDLLPQPIIEQRISQGDRIFLARHRSKPVAYLFAAQKRCWINEVGDWLIIDSGEVYLYDAFTIDDYRGKLIYTYLITNATRFFRNEKYSYCLIFSTVSNINSLKGIQRAGLQCYETVDFYKLFGLKIWNYKNAKE